jgi:hypothetical protein
MITPDRVPRSFITFPFVPNRVAAAVVDSLVEKLAHSSLLVVKQEDSEALRISEADKEGRKRKREVAKIKDDECHPEVDLDAWKEGGHMQTEWSKRDRCAYNHGSATNSSLLITMFYLVMASER